MTKERKVSDEEIISSLLSNGTLKAAAAALSVSERTLYTRMNDGTFQGLYKAAKADVIRVAVARLNERLQDAIDVTAEIMSDKDNNPATRLQAAQTILNNAAKFAERLQDAELHATRQAEANAFSWF